MIIKKSSVFWIFLICAIGSWLFYVKYGVMQVEDRIKQVRCEIVEERKNYHILKAEWKALTTPDRIQRLAVKYLQVSQMNPEQLCEYDASIFHDEVAKYKKTQKLSKLISKIMAQRENDEKRDGAENGGEQ